MTRRHSFSQSGFSIMELILTLVLLGTVAAMLAPYYQAGVTSSPTMVFQTAENADLQEAMENIIEYVNGVAFQNYDPSEENSFAEFSKADLDNLQANLSTLVPADISIEENTQITLYDLANPVLSVEYEQPSDPFFRKWYLRVTLQNSHGARLTYIFSTGTNYPRYETT